MNPLILWAALPAFVFALLLLAERHQPATHQNRTYTQGDWIMNLTGFFMQGVVVPLAGYLLASHAFPQLLPQARGCLVLGFAGAFVLNFVGVDFLYYLQHRAFHQVPWLWKLHEPHHCSPVVNVWATSRNALVTNFLFVYMLVNPVLGYLCDVPEGFFAGAMVTAALDLARHSNIRVRLPLMQGVLILPQDHHRHHDGDKEFANFGANFLVWDRLFGTADVTGEFPLSYSSSESCPVTTQLFTPWIS